MQLTGMRYGRKLLETIDFPAAEVLTEDASHEEIAALIKKSPAKKVVVKPVFLGGVGKKGKAGLVRICNNVYEAHQAKRDLFFARHTFGNHTVQADGVTFEEFIPSPYEIYVSIAMSTEHRAPVMILTHEGGVDIEELPLSRKKIILFNPATGIKAFHINDALIELGAPKEIVSPLVQHLPKLWDLYNNYGLTMLEINPIRMGKDKDRWVPYACDIKAQFDQDDPAHTRIHFPEEIFSTEFTAFEAEINMLRTYQGQSDVVELNPHGTILPFMFGGGANSAATEILGHKAIVSSDYGGNPPYAKMRDIASISFKHWLAKTNVVLVIGGKANNTDIFVTLKGITDALKEHISKNPKVHVVIGRGGPNVIQGMAYARDVLDNLGIPYRFFGHDSSMIRVLNYALELDEWICAGGDGSGKKAPEAKPAQKAQAKTTKAEPKAKAAKAAAPQKAAPKKTAKK